MAKDKQVQPLEVKILFNSALKHFYFKTNMYIMEQNVKAT